VSANVAAAAIVQASLPLPHLCPWVQGYPIGIPYNVVNSSTRYVVVSAGDINYADESDLGPYPLPDVINFEAPSDHHAIFVDSDTCMLYDVRRGVVLCEESRGRALSDCPPPKLLSSQGLSPPPPPPNPYTHPPPSSRYELWSAYVQGTGVNAMWTAGSGATWSLNSNALRPDGYGNVCQASPRRPAPPARTTPRCPLCPRQ
jgi:hypothetical protein